MLSAILFLLFSYLLGIINSSYYLVRLLGKKDIRKIHSGTAGAMNVGRIYGKLGFLCVFVVDFFKGYLVIWLPVFYDFSPVLTETMLGLLGVFFCMLGHSYPPQLKFKGGKGVSVFSGSIFFLNPYLFLLALFLLAFGKWIGKNFLLLFFTAFVINILYFLKHSLAEGLVLLLPTSLIVWRHRKDFKKK